MKFDKERNGSPYDRGRADAYKGRPFRPHYFVGPTYASTRIIIDKNVKSPELHDYTMGYKYG